MRRLKFLASALLVLMISLYQTAAFSPPQTQSIPGGSTSKSNQSRLSPTLLKNNNNGDTEMGVRRGTRSRRRLSLRRKKAKHVFLRKNIDDATIEARTLNWIKKFVIGLNLCPFAERPMKNKELYIKVIRGDDDSDIEKAVTAALHFTADETPGVTTIVVAPEYHPNDFERYLGMVQFLEQVIMDGEDEYKLSEYVQIAPFHPLFQLDDSSPVGEKEPIDVYTNRGPYPMFHVIRTDDVAEAVDKLDGDPSKVWSRNQRLLQNMDERLGREATVNIVMGAQSEEEDRSQKKILTAVMKQTTIEMKQQEEEGGAKPLERGVWEI
jgi:hypothetical protein